jgi:hypothetical protein
LQKCLLQRQHAVILYLDELMPTFLPTCLDIPEMRAIASFSESSGALNSAPGTSSYIFHFMIGVVPASKTPASSGYSGSPFKPISIEGML